MLPGYTLGGFWLCAFSITPLLFSGLPVVTIDPSKSKTQEGGNLEFVCHVMGSPTPTVSWRTEELRSPFFTQVVMNFQSVYIFCSSNNIVSSLRTFIYLCPPLLLILGSFLYFLFVCVLTTAGDNLGLHVGARPSPDQCFVPRQPA